MSIHSIICGDSAHVLKTFEQDCIDLTVTSPPYDNLRTYNGFTFDFETIARELYRVTKPGGVVVWVVGDATVNGSETTTSAEQKIFFRNLGFNIHDTMIYEKNGPAYPSKDKYYQVFEYMFVFSKGTPNTFNPIKDRENRWYGQKWSKGRTRRDVGGNLKYQDWYKDEGEKFGVRFNIWRIFGGAGYTTKDEYTYVHPAMFPEALARDHILSWSNPGDLVLDPFAGSGTTLKMAKETGRHYVGIEISEEYCKLIERRVLAANVPLPLFAALTCLPRQAKENT